MFSEDRINTKLGTEAIAQIGEKILSYLRNGDAENRCFSRFLFCEKLVLCRPNWCALPLFSAQ
mgnify:CR=1 FL=1|jgi:hypothetical protein